MSLPSQRGKSFNAKLNPKSTLSSSSQKTFFPVEDIHTTTPSGDVIMKVFKFLPGC